MLGWASCINAEIFAHTRHSVSDSLEGDAVQIERQVNTVEQSNSSAYIFYEKKIHCSDRDIPDECPTTATLPAPWSEIAVRTADKMNGALLPVSAGTQHERPRSRRTQGIASDGDQHASPDRATRNAESCVKASGADKAPTVLSDIRRR